MVTMLTINEGFQKILSGNGFSTQPLPKPSPLIGFRTELQS